MPQLVPFYFINEITFAFSLLFICLFVFSTYVLPNFVRLFIARLFVTKI